jgi:hypothetical protein
LRASHGSTKPFPETHGKRRPTDMKGAQPHRIAQTVALLAMTVMELRRIADSELAAATELRQIADQLEDEANALAHLSSD